MRGGTSVMRTPMRLWTRQDQRGLAVSVMVVCAMAMLVLVLGLVVDGGRQLAAQQRAEAVANRAARAGADAAAAGSVLDRPDVVAAQAAARATLASEGVPGEVSTGARRVRVSTTVSAETVFLSAIGISHVSGAGQAEAMLAPTDFG